MRGSDSAPYCGSNANTDYGVAIAKPSQGTRMTILVADQEDRVCYEVCSIAASDSDWMFGGVECRFGHLEHLLAERIPISGTMRDRLYLAHFLVGNLPTGDFTEKKKVPPRLWELLSECEYEYTNNQSWLTD